jgi:Uma2 family endonuclease
MRQPLREKSRATYANVLAAPRHLVAEIIDGELHLSPRPTFPHARAGGELFGELREPFGRGRGGPGGWIFLLEPELHLGDEPSILVPDIAGWRRERMPVVESVPYTTLAPDWLCEVLSPSTESFDRTQKLAVYARAGVGHCWFVNPIARTLEVLRNQGDGRWVVLSSHGENAKVRAEPFDAMELDLTLLWIS